MNIDKLIEFGRLWLDMNSDSKDSDVYEFFEKAVKSFELWKSLPEDVLKLEYKSYEMEYYYALCDVNYLLDDYLKGLDHSVKE